MSACGKKIENNTDANIESEKNTTVEENTGEVEPIEYKSDMGYSIMYDPSIITLDDTGDADVFTYNTDEKLDAPVYISVMYYKDMDSELLTNGIILQSGIDGLKAEKTYFGAESIETQCVYIENDVEGITRIQIFYVIPVQEGGMVVEIGGYIGAPTRVDATINDILGTFYLNKD